MHRRSGEIAVARLTPRDIEILKLLTRYRYLSADYLSALIGGSLKPLIHRLSILSREPNLYLDRPEQQRHNANANYRRLVYELDDRGATVLRQYGFAYEKPKYQRNFAHELMACEIMASIEIGARGAEGARLIDWSEILASKNMPNATRNSRKPHHVPVAFAANGARLDTEIAADTHPFGIERTIDGRKSFVFFPGIEADCGTEPVDTNDYERSSIAKKFLAYRAIAEQDIHRSHFGFPNLLVPFVTTTTARMASMMRLLERVTDGKGSKMFLFKTFPAFTSFEPPWPAGGRMLTEPWQRAGYPAFNMLSS